LSLNASQSHEPALITVTEFASRIGVSYWTALDIVKQKTLRDKGAVVKINDKKRGGIRIDWPVYRSLLKGSAKPCEEPVTRSDRVKNPQGNVIAMRESQCPTG